MKPDHNLCKLYQGAQNPFIHDPPGSILSATSSFHNLSPSGIAATYPVPMASWHLRISFILYSIRPNNSLSPVAA